MIKTKWKKASFYKQIYQNMAIKVVFFFYHHVSCRVASFEVATHVSGSAFFNLGIRAFQHPATAFLPEQDQIE